MARLLFDETQLPALRAKCRREPIRSMLARLIDDAETDDRATPGSKAETEYGDATAAQRCAFLYAITRDPVWAAKARRYVRSRLDDPRWADPKQKGLTLYYVGKALALALDWCDGAPAWDSGFVETLREKLRAQADVIFADGGAEQNRNPASNWQGLRFSSAGLIYLALNDPNDSARIGACYRRVAAYLRANLGEADDSRGWNIEGLGYTYYPMGNGVCPFAVAAKRYDASLDLLRDVPALGSTLWTVYAALVKTRDGGLVRPDFGDDNPGASAEGTMGFAFHFCPLELWPGLKFWYDRTVGAKGDRSFDAARFGTIASILNYPLDLRERDPMTIPAWRERFVDTRGNGFFTFRDAYSGDGDTVAQLYVKRRGNKGHSGPDALSFRIIGAGALLATGGGRYGLKFRGQDAYLRSMNTLYPTDPDDPLVISAESGEVVGTPRIRSDGGGSVTARIAKNNVGVENHIRAFSVSFPKEPNVLAKIRIDDTSDNGRVWQLCAPDTCGVEIVAPDAFLVTGPGGAAMRGTVLSVGGDPRLRVGERLRGSDAGSSRNNRFVLVHSDNGKFTVELVLSRPTGGARASDASKRGIGGRAG